MNINMSMGIDSEFRANWQVPDFDISFWAGRSHSWCVVVPVINEGLRIRSLLDKMAALNISAISDIIIIDGGSTDGSLGLEWLMELGVAALLVKTGPGKLSAQLRCAYAFALEQGYEGVITIDGNDKDDPRSIPDFIEGLKAGFDFIQASRFIDGGVAENTPMSRNFAIRILHAPLLSIFSGFKWSDTTQGFRAYSRKMMMDPAVAIFREIFFKYELLAYLSYRAPRLGYKCVEYPTIRRYPKNEIPTKISGIRGKLELLHVLMCACFGRYNP